MRISSFLLSAVTFASPALAQDQEPTVTPLLPMSESFGQLIDEGYDLITIDFNGIAWLEDGTNKLVACALSGNPSVEIRSICNQVGK